MLRRAEELFSLLREEGKEPGGIRRRPKGVGLLQLPQLRGDRVVDRVLRAARRTSNAQEIADTLVDAFMSGADDEGDDAGEDGILGVDELHIVFTEFKSMLSQAARRAASHRWWWSTSEMTDTGPHTLFSFEPDAETLFGALLPRYIATRVYAAMLEAAASESASRRRAMKSASDNADDLIKALTLMANRERQAQITQEISEIVGGANALADAQPRRSP